MPAFTVTYESVAQSPAAGSAEQRLDAAACATLSEALRTRPDWPSDWQAIVEAAQVPEDVTGPTRRWRLPVSLQVTAVDEDQAERRAIPVGLLDAIVQAVGAQTKAVHALRAEAPWEVVEVTPVRPAVRARPG